LKSCTVDFGASSAWQLLEYFSADLIFSALLCFAVPVITDHWVTLRGQLEEDCVDGASAGFSEVCKQNSNISMQLPSPQNQQQV